MVQTNGYAFLYSDGDIPQQRLKARVKQDIDSNPTLSEISLILNEVLLSGYCASLMRTRAINCGDDTDCTAATVGSIL